MSVWVSQLLNSPCWLLFFILSLECWCFSGFCLTRTLVGPVRAKSPRCVRLFVTLWTIAHQAPLSMGFSRQEYWSGLPCLPPGNLPDPGVESESLMSPALTGRFFTTSTICWAKDRGQDYSLLCSPFLSAHSLVLAPELEKEAEKMEEQGCSLPTARGPWLSLLLSLPLVWPCCLSGLKVVFCDPKQEGLPDWPNYTGLMGRQACKENLFFPGPALSPIPKWVRHHTRCWNYTWGKSRLDPPWILSSGPRKFTNNNNKTKARHSMMQKPRVCHCRAPVSQAWGGRGRGTHGERGALSRGLLHVSLSFACWLSFPCHFGKVRLFFKTV